jgi:hypothetical protein
MAKTPRQRRSASKERMWRRRMARWQSSGLSARAYCRGFRLSEAQFHYWRRELRLRDREAAEAMPSPAFAAVELKPTGLAEGYAARDVVEIVLSAGLRVRVRDGFDPSTLSRVLGVLGEAAC